MEYKEINRYRPYVHDCNECKRCQRSIKDNKDYNSCAACWFIFFEKHYKDFSSGNKEVNEIIKNSIYTPPYIQLYYCEWIPWERLSNINEIAKGGFGIIYKATLIDGLINKYSIKHHGSLEFERERIGTEVAIKVIKTNSSEVFKELNIQRAMFMNNGGCLQQISSILGITQNAETLEYGIVMQFAEHGDMRKYLSINFHSMSWSDKLLIAWNIASGLSQIHSSGMVHRDLHSGNILQFDNQFINIGDLGLCQPVNHEATTTKEKKIYGVIPYIPPEVFRGEKFRMAGDIFSFAMLLWELATGKPPFHDRSHDHILIMDILNGQRPKITYPLIPPSIAEMIVKCWDPNPKNRPTAKELKNELGELRFSYNSEFLESEKYVKKMLKNDSTTNHSKTAIMTTTTKIKTHPQAIYTSRVLSLQMFEETKDDS
ncbi:hypothetical protein G9A89_004049 [Geosiphon pyriformis]|nr:hypothetical protein G9A89_004049 [Geosiphon pyriformis]